MKALKHTVPALLSVILIPASAQSFAQAATLDDCQAIQDRLARYACYDSWDAVSGTVRQSAPRASSAPRQQQEEDEVSLFGRVFGRDADNAEPQEQAEVAADSDETGVTAFGRTGSTAQVIEGDKGTELIDSVAELEQLGPSLWLVTLEGGQQWKQMLSKRYNLSVGDQVRIYPTGWGSSYRLSVARLGSYIQVERVDAGPAIVSSNTAAPRPQPSQPAPQREEEERSLLSRIFDRDSDEEADAPRPAVAEGPETVEDFGRIQADARVLEGADGKTELVDTVADLEQLGPSLWLITLESGQTWKQMLSKRYNLEVGDEVRIYPTRWGSSYRLSSRRAGSYIQVERVD